MTAGDVLALALRLAPAAPVGRLAPIADAIAHATKDPAEARELVALSWVETTLGRRGVPFGLSCCYRRGMGLETAALRARDILRAGTRCGRALAARHHWYRLGRCGIDAEARRRARLVRRLQHRPD